MPHDDSCHFVPREGPYKLPFYVTFWCYDICQTMSWKTLGPSPSAVSLHLVSTEILHTGLCAYTIPLYERRRKFVTYIHANLVFQACISFLRCFRTPGAPIRKILVHTGMLPCLIPSWSQTMQIRSSFQSRSDLVLVADHALYFVAYLVFHTCISFYRVSDKVYPPDTKTRKGGFQRAPRGGGRTPPALSGPLSDATWVHQAVAFAIASDFCRKRPFARNIHSKNEISPWLSWHVQNHSPSLANCSHKNANASLGCCFAHLPEVKKFVRSSPV